MNGSDFLQSDGVAELLLHIQKGSSGAFVKLSEKYAPLLESETLRYVDSLSGADYDDLRQGALVSLYRAALSYRPDKGVTFGLYAKICISNALISYLRVLKKGVVQTIVDPQDDRHFVRDYEDPTERILTVEIVQAN